MLCWSTLYRSETDEIPTGSFAIVSVRSVRMGSPIGSAAAGDGCSEDAGSPRW